MKTLSSVQKKLSAEQRLAAKKEGGLIRALGEDVEARLRDKDLRQAHEKTALIRLADQFFAAGGRSLEQVAYDEAALRKAQAVAANERSPDIPSHIKEPLRMELQMTYLHQHSFTANPASMSTLQDELAHAEISLRHKKPGILVATEGSAFPHYTSATLQSSSQPAMAHIPSSRSPQKRGPGPRVSKEVRKHGLDLPQYNVRVFLGDIPDPPNITYSKNYRDLAEDWYNVESPSSLVINEGRVPLCAWDLVYKNNKPQIWETLKIRWRNWRLIYYCYEAYGSSWERVEEKYGLFTGTVYIIPHMTALLKAINTEKKARNAADVALAHIFAPNEEFAQKFFNIVVGMVRWTSPTASLDEERKTKGRIEASWDEGVGGRRRKAGSAEFWGRGLEDPRQYMRGERGE